ncbi:alpha/beta hydrolase family protein [Streptomyces sp. NPDC050504]|uniref:alpha/beta hydrolase family protein n=1 Tax=Streptomyces sp. NPDC050504 TaxID=3365618 RepID=UPI0037AF2A00
MRRVTRATTAGLAVLAVAAITTGPAQAEPSPGTTGSVSGASPRGSGEQLPKGWLFTGEGAGRHLVWTSSEPVPMGDARVEFYAGDKLLGRPVASKDRRSFRLPLDTARLGSPEELRVLAGGRRLDAVGAEEARSLAPRGAAPLRAEAQLPVNPVDPGKPGPYRTAAGEYALPSVKLPGFTAPVEMQARVIGPVAAPGKRPVALFLHGRHATCFTAAGEVTGDWPCAPGAEPIPSYQGYQRAQQLLASQGYVTVSVSANGINGQDWNAEDGGAQARSSLVRQHLARWAQWAANRGTAPASVRAVAPADLNKVLLVGHSRGGEGVNRAALDSLYPAPAHQDGYRGPVRWKIRGNVLIGPTIFGQNPVPDVPSTTILPGCDGDVSDLQGQMYLDAARGIGKGAALQSALYVVGANHNFFNSEWTPGQAKAPADDDFAPGENPDPVCSPGTRTRLTAVQQQQAGASYIAAAARLFVAGDDKVRPLLDGTGRRAPSAGPARVLSHAIGANRTPAFLPGPGLKVSGAGARLCAQVATDESRSCLPFEGAGRSPHFAFWEALPEPGRDAVAMRWSRPGTTAKVSAVKPFSLKGSASLALRAFVPANAPAAGLDVTLVDASGRKAKLGRATVESLPGSEATASLWAREVRVPLAAAARAGLDLKRIKTLELTQRSGSRQVWLIDAWGWRPGTPAVTASPMPRVDFGRLTVKEGDSGERTYRIPVRVSGKGSGQIRLFTSRSDSEQIQSRLVTVRAGVQDVNVPVKIRGNTRYGYDMGYDAFAKSVRGAVIGSHHGGVMTLNDDPMPDVVVKPVADRVTEGQALKWRMTLSAPSDADVMGEFRFLPVTEGTELTTADVDPVWLEENFGEKPTPVRPLSKIYDDPSLVLAVTSRTGAELAIPILKNPASQPERTFKAQWFTLDAKWEPHPGPVVTGTVRDAS